MGSTFSSYLPTPLIPPQPPHPSPDLLSSEHNLLLSLSRNKIPYTKRFIPLPSGHLINTLSAGSPSNPPLLLLHGWGAGIAFFARNLPLASRFRLHMIDMLGFGASSRPVFSLDSDAEQAELFFVHAVEQWVDSMAHIEHFRDIHLVGHSMGGYIAVAYALKRPDRVRNVILASPVGIPHPPKSKLPSGMLKNILFRTIFWFWDRGYTPQTILRALPMSVGRYLAWRLINTRFVTHSAEQAPMVEYFYQLSIAPASGEFSLSTLLESGAYARRPLVDRLGALKMDVRILYGDRDWMLLKGGGECLRDVKVCVLQGAGHHLYFDNVDAFMRQVEDACDSCIPESPAVAPSP